MLQRVEKWELFCDTVYMVPCGFLHN